ncbi:MAG: extracellular solute-binding protein [Paenibacillus sp.]|jgi:ABC-type glycerol-3-phosphate transport system substrate-binding protein|nr:extracellular solute-binding protein [Paenibacillus sp.]
MNGNRWTRFALAVLLPVVAAGSAACDSSERTSGEPEYGPGHRGLQVVGLSCNPSFDRQTDQERRVHERIAEQTGADVRMVMSDGPCRTKRTLMLSAGEQLDFAEMTIAEAAQAYNEGVILPLNELLDRHGPNLKKNILPEAFAKATYDGRILGVPIENNLLAINALQIRSDWLAKLQLPIPETIDEFERVLQAFKERDPDGNGIDDTVPLSVASGGDFTMLESVLGPSFLPQAFNWWQDADGKLKPPELHPGYTAMLTRLVEWNRKGYIWPDMLMAAAAKQQELIAANRAGAVAATFSGTILNAGEKLRKTVPDYSYLPVALKGEHGINKLPAFPIASSVWVIFRKNADPKTVMRYFDYQATYEGHMLSWFGIEGDNYGMTANGMVEFIAEDKTDLAKANYYAKYKTVFFNWPGMKAWPIDAWVFGEYNLKKDQLNRLPRFETIDSGVFYDTNKWKSYSRLNDLNDYWNEHKIRIFNGEIPVDSWDGIVQRWLDIGGRQMIEDRNGQFAAAYGRQRLPQSPTPIP